MWHQYLFSKRVRDLNPDFAGGLPDEFRVLTAGAADLYGITEQLLYRKSSRDHPNIAFTLDAGGSLIVGFHGLVEDALGDATYARERKIVRGKEVCGRPITYVHAYIADGARNDALPSLALLSERHRCDLGTILRRANAGEDRVCVELVALPAHSGSVETDWERRGQRFMAGHEPNRLTLFTPEGALIQSEALRLSQLRRLPQLSPNTTEVEVSAPEPHPRERTARTIVRGAREAGAWDLLVRALA